VVAVTSGKGGAGKTNVSVNLAVALARLGRRTMLVDCDVGLADAHILLGLDGERDIGHLALKERSLGEVSRNGPAGLVLVPGHSGPGLGAGLAAPARAELASALRPSAAAFDTILVDTGGGMDGDALATVAASDLILLVLGPEPTAFMDAYAVLKALALRHGCSRFAVLTNRVAGEAAGRALFDRFRTVVEQFLPVHVDHLGSIPEDPYLRDAVFAKRCCVEAFPSAPASAAFTRLARRIAAHDLPLLPGGHRFFGLEARHGAH
jgi:flagellar biosynthesis protein FlhG